METLELPTQPFLIFLITLARIGGLVSFAPFWSHKAASPKIRVTFALVLSLSLAPAVSAVAGPPPLGLSALLLLLIGELTIGMAFGFIGRAIFSGFELAAHFLASQMGFSLAGTIDPSTQAQTTAFGTAAQMLGLMVLLGANGHHWFLAASIKSLSKAAPGEVPVSPALLDLLVRLSADALTVGVALAAPAIIVLLAAEFALEFFGKTAPSFQVFILGFPVKIGIGLLIVGATLYFLPAAFRSNLANIHDGLGKAISFM